MRALGLREAQAIANAARAALEAGQLDRSVRLLETTQRLAQSLDPSHASVSVRIHVAKSDERLASISPKYRSSSLLRAHASLMEAESLARARWATIACAPTHSAT